MRVNIYMENVCFYLYTKKSLAQAHKMHHILLHFPVIQDSTIPENILKNTFKQDVNALYYTA